ncbi:MAG TPA: amidohydrolase family protein [Candidatus Sulfopaludibacter sp.]|jgi:imidazolonepropionase-like amidohydrolase|nr:amidohydrolase family protein [Candidatus Sulfopaludibacter sp.]
MTFRCLVIFLAVATAAAQSPVSGKRPRRLLIHNATVIDGNGTPASGPKDIVIENNTITDVIALDPVAVSRGGRGGAQADAVIDATGKYVMPGLINAHAHLQEERGGKPQPIEYELDIWLACGITTVRDVGSDTRRALELRKQSAEGQIAAPRIFVYPMFGRPKDAAAARAHVRELKAMGADGIKILGIDRDTMQAMEDEAHKLGLRIAHHAGVEETNAWDDIKFGTTSIEHWYGIPDAAIEDGVQHFPSSYNYNNETDRFRYAGHLFREANPERLTKVLEAMVQAGVAWDPTMDIYEASRDLQRAQTQPWFAEYLHPTLEEYFRPNPANHGSYFIGWTSTDEAYWKENYRLWMAALRQFDRLGGLIGMGDDAGFIYQMYGFGLIRGMELHQEAGFHPLKIIQQATGNNAKILGQQDRLGRVRAGYAADVLVVNGNPLENLKVLYPTGVEEIRDGKAIHTGGVEWTIKDGIPYHAPELMARVKEMVAAAKKR